MCYGLDIKPLCAGGYIKQNRYIIILSFIFNIYNVTTQVFMLISSSRLYWDFSIKITKKIEKHTYASVVVYMGNMCHMFIYLRYMNNFCYIWIILPSINYFCHIWIIFAIIEYFCFIWIILPYMNNGYFCSPKFFWECLSRI